jgi:DNA-binding transcriptional LysR family regulator
MLGVKRMRVLKEVAARGSFSGAADALSYTQSAVSQQIAALEREAGTILVERSARGVRLTDAGTALVAHADAIIARLDAAERELEAIAGLRGGHLRLVAFPSAGASLMPLAVAEFRRRHPAVELTLEPAEPAEAMDALRGGQCDVALSLEASFEPFESEAIAKTPLLDDPMFLVLPGDHPLAHKPNLRLEDLADESFIQGAIGTCPDTRILLRAANAAGFEPRIAFQSNDYTAIQGFIAAGVGMGLIPDLALVSVRDDIVIRDLGPQAPSRGVFAATLAGAYQSPAASAMLDILVEVGRQYENGRRKLALAS